MNLTIKLFSTLLLWFASATISFSCTNLLITKGASADGSTMITYAADSQALYGELYYWASAYYPAGAMLDVYEWDSGKYLGQIKQVSETYRVVGNMNEHQLAIGETTFGGRGELRNLEGIIDYGSLIYITLQRATNAREAIKIMHELVQEYGYYSSGESFSISDANEVWIMELIGKGDGNKGAVWVARKVPDGYISGHANQARIREFPYQKENKWNDLKAECFNSADVIQFAKDKGYFDGADSDFSFVDAYAPVDYGALRFCEARVWSAFNRASPSQNISMDYVKGVKGASIMPLWIKPDNKLTVHDVMELMRDHFENTDYDMTQDIGAGPHNLPYRWRPLTWEIDSVEYCNERAISTQQTGFSFVSQSRSWLPNEIGGVLWFGVDDTYSTVYVPMYCSIKEVPFAFAVGNGSLQEFTWQSAFWVFNFVTNYAYGRYDLMITDIRREQAQIEGEFFAQQIGIESAANFLYNQSPELSRDYLTKYCAEMSAKTMQRWTKLGEELIVKYLDGYMKDEHGTPTYKGYSSDWYRQVIKQTDDHFQMKE